MTSSSVTDQLADAIRAKGWFSPDWRELRSATDALPEDEVLRKGYDGLRGRINMVMSKREAVAAGANSALGPAR